MSEFNRRAFLYSASAASLAGVALSNWSRAAAAADEGQKNATNAKRKFTLCLSCGMLGVRAEPRETIDLAAQFGFESVEPPVGLLMGLSDAELAEMLAELKAKHLAWGPPACRSTSAATTRRSRPTSPSCPRRPRDCNGPASPGWPPGSAPRTGR